MVRLNTQMSTFLAMVLAVVSIAMGCKEKATGKPGKPEKSEKAETAKVKRRFLDNLPWSKPSREGLQTRLTVPTRQFATGEQIPARLELRHKDGKSFAQNTIASQYRGRITVTDARGKAVGERTYPLDFNTILKAGETRVLCEFDLATDYALRTPGRYAVRFGGHKNTPQGLVDLPASPSLEVEIRPRAVSWGRTVGGLRVGLAPAKVTLRAGEMSFKVRIHYENTGKAPIEVPVHKGANAYRVMFGGEEDGKPFYACYPIYASQRVKVIRPAVMKLQPGKRFSEEFRLELPSEAAERQPARYLQPQPFGLPALAAGESLRLRAGLLPTRKISSTDGAWRAPGTLKSGAITVTMKAPVKRALLPKLLASTERKVVHDALLAARDSFDAPEVVPHVISTLDRLLKNPRREEGLTRGLACGVLGKYRDRRAIPVLLKALEDPYLRIFRSRVPGVGGTHVEWVAVWRHADSALRRIAGASPVEEPRQREPIRGQQKSFQKAWKAWWKKNKAEHEHRKRLTK